MHRRHLLGAIVLGSLSLTGCGFHLRGAFSAPFQKLYIQGASNSRLVLMLRRMIEAGSNVQVVASPSEADAILEIVSDNRGQDILAYNDRGQVREYTLTRTIGLRLVTPDGYEYFKPTYFTDSRNLPYSDSQFLSFSDEANKVYQDMLTSLCTQVLDVISHVKPRQ